MPWTISLGGKKRRKRYVTLTASRHQPRAFLILPMFSNFGVVLGPLLGGLLADPASNYPHIFSGIPWITKFPYSLPSLFNALFVAFATCAVFFCLGEVGHVVLSICVFTANCSLDARELSRQGRLWPMVREENRDYIRPIFFSSQTLSLFTNYSNGCGKPFALPSQP